jgi:hypothetical protein
MITSLLHASRRGTAASIVLLASMILSTIGCADEGASEDPALKQVVGPAGQGGDPASGLAWQAVLVDWPKQGNLSILYGDPATQARFENWMDGARPLVAPPKEIHATLDKVQGFNDRLIALDGDWGTMPDRKMVRAMSVRGLRKTLWADVRRAAVRGDAERATDLLVVMANLPRISHAYDGSVRGLLATVSASDSLGWAMKNVAGKNVELDESQKARIRTATGWLDDPSPFGEADPETDPRRVAVLGEFQRVTRPNLIEARSRLCD